MSFINPIITPRLVERVLSGYVLDLGGIHGMAHWLQVERNALELAEKEGVSSDVLSLFALFHDSRRRNDGGDREHGRRGAALVQELHGKEFNLTEKELAQLHHACEYHTLHTHHPDPIIGICWDADRLDLPRVGITPNPWYFNCKSAKTRVG